VPWYKDLFGSDPLLTRTQVRSSASLGLPAAQSLGVTQFPDLDSTEPFNERRPGLDHLAFGCGQPAMS